LLELHPRRYVLEERLSLRAKRISGESLPNSHQHYSQAPKWCQRKLGRSQKVFKTYLPAQLKQHFIPGVSLEVFQKASMQRGENSLSGSGRLRCRALRLGNDSISCVTRAACEFAIVYGKKPVQYSPPARLEFSRRSLLCALPRAPANGYRQSLPFLNTRLKRLCEPYQATWGERWIALRLCKTSRAGPGTVNT
jgi:hypothetical protein